MIDVPLTHSPLVTFLVHLQVLWLRLAEATMATAPPWDTQQYHRGGRVGGGRKICWSPPSESICEHVLLLCLCVFGGRGRGIYVCTGVLNGTNSLKIHPHTVHSRSFKKLQKKKQRKEKQTAKKKKQQVNTNQVLWRGGPASPNPAAPVGCCRGAFP